MYLGRIASSILESMFNSIDEILLLRNQLENPKPYKLVLNLFFPFFLLSLYRHNWQYFNHIPSTVKEWIFQRVISYHLRPTVDNERVILSYIEKLFQF